MTLPTADPARATTESSRNAPELSTTARRASPTAVTANSKAVVRCSPTFLTMRCEPLPKNAHVSAFIVPMDTPGVSVGKSDKKMGQAASHIADIILEDVHLPADALLGGEEGKGFRYILSGMNAERILIAAECIGDAKWFIA